VTPVLGAATGTSLALGGGAIGSDALEVTGTTTHNGTVVIAQPNANTSILTSTGYSLTGASAVGGVSYAGTWNTSATPTAFSLAITNTASNAASLLMNLLAGSGGATSEFSVDTSGNTTAAGNFQTSAGGFFQWNTRCKIGSNANGTILIEDNAGTHSFQLTAAAVTATPIMQLGGANNASPVAQTIGTQGSRGGTDSNVSGANLTIQSGFGTGNSTVSTLMFRVPVVAASGTTAQTYATAITINNSTSSGIQFNGYGAGALSTDASGNITATSDPRKKHIQRPFVDGLAAIKAINPIVYKWRADSGMETDHEYAGFDAENVRSVLALATGRDKEGYLSLQDRALLATCVNAIKELSERI
jgi:hypothetical protein